MAYKGQIANIILGQGGLNSDDPENLVSPAKLVRAINITLTNGYLEKDFGSMRLNATAQLPDGIVELFDYFPNASTQRLITVNRSGKVYRFKTFFGFDEVTPVAPAPNTLNTSQFVTMVKGGAEETGKPRKLFILSGNNPIQVIEGDGTTRRNIEKPASDWSGSNQPFGMIFFVGFPIAWGNENSPHRLYIGSNTDNEDYTTTPLTIEVDPSIGEGIRSAFVWKGRVYILKHPLGLFQLDTPSFDPTTWNVPLVSDVFGAASPYGTVQVLDDVFIANQYGSVTSIKAVQAFGDVKNSDVFHILRGQEFARSEISKVGFGERHGVYYQDKKIAMFTFRSLDSNLQNRIAAIDFSRPDQGELYWSTKDQPNTLVLRRDDFGIQRPVYGSEDGYIYQMDSPNRWIGDVEDTPVQNSYEMNVRLPQLDLGIADDGLSEHVKIFDFIELVYFPTGRFTVTIDIFVDGRFSEQKQFLLRGTTDLNQFKLDAERFTERTPRSLRKPMHGSGRRVSFQIKNSELGNVRLSKLKIYYRLGGQAQKKV